jgi:hypothetical protein
MQARSASEVCTFTAAQATILACASGFDTIRQIGKLFFPPIRSRKAGIHRCARGEMLLRIRTDHCVPERTSPPIGYPASRNLSPL